jgi:NTP pyrophosphatase (non-canonical NTP hydrolase)
MKPQYEPKTTAQALGYLVEECGEVLAAVGKTQRWGLESTNPDLPIEEDRETNRDWILRELKDLSGAIDRARLFLGPEDGPQ